jgi:RHS repeat-associated protein
VADIYIHPGSTRMLTDDYGDVVWPSPSGEPNKLAPFGKDVVVGARYYTADFPRFISPDPVSGKLETPITWNRYLYCRNDPINLIDPDGENWKHYLTDLDMIGDMLIGVGGTCTASMIAAKPGIIMISSGVLLKFAAYHVKFDEVEGNVSPNAGTNTILLKYNSFPGSGTEELVEQHELIRWDNVERHGADKERLNEAGLIPPEEKDVVNNQKEEK